MPEFYVTIKQGGVIVANMVKCFSEKDPRQIAGQIMTETAKNWNIPVKNGFSWAVFETVSSYIPIFRSKHWKD